MIPMPFRQNGTRIYQKSIRFFSTVRMGFRQGAKPYKPLGIRRVRRYHFQPCGPGGLGATLNKETPKTLINETFEGPKNPKKGKLPGSGP